MEKNKQIIIISLSILVLFLFFGSFFMTGRINPSSENKYYNDVLGISFDMPKNYFVEDHSFTNSLYSGFDLYEDTKGNRLLLSGEIVGELPVSISCVAFENPEDISIKEWVNSDEFETLFFAQDVNLTEENIIPDVSAYGYDSDGLYASKNIVFKHSSGKIFNCRVSYITLQDKIVDDFQKFLMSIKLL
ncbi:MAG: hypothetical protein WC095_01865 [Candidatus Paceibacterota bacterium]